MMRNRRILSTPFLMVLLCEYGILECHLLAQTKVETSVPTTVTVTSMDWTTVILQALVLITTLMGFVYSWLRENRNRKWDLEDRAQARAETMQKQNEIKHEVQKVQKKVQENTDLTQQAQDQSRVTEERLQHLIQKVMTAKDPNHDG
jgi:hypothetical protein